MNLKQMFSPKLVRRAEWVIFDSSNDIPTWLARRAFVRGEPIAVHGFLNDRHLKGTVARSRQGVLAVSAGENLLRFAHGDAPKFLLAREFKNWRTMKQSDFGNIICQSMSLEDHGDWQVLTSETLQPVSTEDHPKVMVPILDVLARHSPKLKHPDLPATISAGLGFAKAVWGGALPVTFVNETDLREGLSAALRTGLSHRDMHSRNVMTGNGKPVLVDLKKCDDGRVIALDVLNLACHARSARHGGSMIREAFDGHRNGWPDDHLQAALGFVDFPKALWGPAYALHALGQYAMKRNGVSSLAAGYFIRRMVQQDWRVDHA